jgi:hypothetical protein
MNDRSYMNDAPRSGAAGGIPVAGFIVGALVGAGVALLLAPGPGEDTRRKLGETARRLGSAANDAVKRGREELSRRSDGEQAGESFRPGSRREREPLGGGRTPQAT